MTREAAFCVCVCVCTRSCVHLPDDFLERVRLLSSQTIVHIPVSFRSRAAKAMAATLLGVARGFVRGNMLEQGRSKLLYGPVPRGFNTRTEMATWFSI